MMRFARTAFGVALLFAVVLGAGPAHAEVSVEEWPYLQRVNVIHEVNEQLCVARYE